MKTITVSEYNLDPESKLIADQFMAAYGYDADAVDQIDYDNNIVMVRVLIDRATNTRTWYAHDR